MSLSVSRVTGRASSIASTGATHTFSTPSTGARYAMRAPSWLNLTSVRSGFPNNAFLGIKSGVWVIVCSSSNSH